MLIVLLKANNTHTEHFRSLTSGVISGTTKTPNSYTTVFEILSGFWESGVLLHGHPHQESSFAALLLAPLKWQKLVVWLPLHRHLIGCRSGGLSWLVFAQVSSLDVGDL